MPRLVRLAALVLYLLPAAALAGPPFLTDDPEPVDYQHNEFYVFSTLDRVDGAQFVQAPAIEYNRGVLPDLQFHIVVSGLRLIPGAFGLNDTELGLKYRFVQETADRPQIGVFPMVELPTGSAARGGNGQAWYKLPLWLQKSWGDWTSYGGAGYAINHAPGMHNYFFGGWLVQKQLNDSWTLGGELFSQSQGTVGGPGFTLFNAGGYYNFTPDFCLLFTVGHTLAGSSNAVAYVGLYWTWGPPTDK